MKRLETIEFAAITIATSAVIVFIIGITLAQWPNWWKWVIFEQTPMTWLEGTILFTTCIFAFMCSTVSVLNNKDRKAKLWFLLGLAFLAFTLDERFAIHERIRDKLLTPHHLNPSIYNIVSVGDSILVAIMIVGLFMLPKVLKILTEKKKAKIYFITSVIVSSIAILMDAINYKMMSLHFQRLEQYIEELFETAGMLLFCFSFFSMLLYYFYKYFKPSQDIN